MFTEHPACAQHYTLCHSPLTMPQCNHNETKEQTETQQGTGTYCNLLLVTWVQIHTCQALNLVLKSRELGLFHWDAKLRLLLWWGLRLTHGGNPAILVAFCDIRLLCRVLVNLARFHSRGYKLAWYREKGRYCRGGEVKGEGVGAKANLNRLFHSSPWNDHEYSPMLSFSLCELLWETQVSSGFWFTIQKER